MYHQRHRSRNEMQKLTLYAQHADGRKLFYPQWDAIGEIVNTRKPTAAVSIQDGGTFPPDSIWIRKPRGSGLQEGWKFADSKPPVEARASSKRIRTKPKRTRRPCVMCTK